MAVLNILTFPDNFLSRSMKPVDVTKDNLGEIVEDMADTMYKGEGVGLAAAQVGIDKRIIVYDTYKEKDRGFKRQFGALINPKIVWEEGKQTSKDEGCLSVPECRSDVRRYAKVRVKGFDKSLMPVEFEADGLLAVVMQHEIDHLNGILFIDRIGSLKRKLYIKRMKKKQR